MAYTDANIIIGTSVDVGGISTGLHNIERSFKRLGRIATLAIGVKALTSFGKAAINAASDLQEVQNVVDVSFQRSVGTVEELGDSVKDMGYIVRETKDGVAMYVEDMSYKMEEMASRAIESFGMSRYQAKQTGGSFMAMGKAMGLTMEEASDMAVTLTELSGDFASFHNISQEYARVALSAVYTGETETLKRYGVVLTEANLQEYASTLGIQTKVKAMGARDKALLRYQYILEATRDVEGDYLRTQDSWANQTRLLKNLWAEFLIVMGNGLSAVFAPMIKIINQIIIKLTQFATTLWQIIGNIFNLTFPGQEKKFANMASGINDTSDAMDGLGDSVAKAGKKAKKQLANFDELNNITTKDTDGGGGAGGLAIDTKDWGDGLAGLFDPNAKDSPWADIDNLYDLGQFIGNKLSNMLKSIDWGKVYRAAIGFGTGLADFLNGLISTDLFKSVGYTIASSLNAAIYSALYFAKRFDFTQFGLKVAEGINSFFATFDFKQLANTLDEWVQGLATALWTALTHINWFGQDGVLGGIQEFFSNLDEETVAIVLGLITFKKVLKSALWGVLFSSFKEGVETALFGEGGIAGLIKTFGSTLAELFITKVLPFFTQVIAPVALILSGIALAVSNFFDMWANGWSIGKAIFEALGVALITIGAILAGAPAAVAAIVAAIVIIVSNLVIVVKDNWDAIKQFAINIFTTIKTTVSSIFNSMYTSLTNIVKSLVSFLKTSINTIYSAWVSVFNSVKSAVLNIMNSLWGGIKGVINSIIGGFQTMVNGVISGVNGVIRAINSVPVLSFNIPTVGNISLPRLAKGAVIPPNKEFMAVLGDQKSGTNIEAPLDTIKQALMETMQQMGGTVGDQGDIVIQIDGVEVFRAVRKQSKIFSTTTGLPAF